MWRLRRMLGLVCLVMLVLPSTATGEAISGETVAANDRNGLFRVEPDLRDCLSPACGGYWVRAVNQAQVRCPDGQLQETCYVAEARFRGHSLADPELAEFRAALFHNRALAQGVIAPRAHPGVGNLGTLRITAGWRAATDQAPTGQIFLVRDNGIRCITTPCFSFDATLVNRGEVTQISDVNLSGVGASEAQLAAAQRALLRQGLLVAGVIQPQPNAGPAGTGQVLVASQFYLPLTAALRPAVPVTRGVPRPTAD